MADNKVVDWGDLGANLQKVKTQYEYEKPPLILSVGGMDCFEFSPILKVDETNKYCHGMVLGYKQEAEKAKVWAMVGTTGTDTEKRAQGVLVAVSSLDQVAIKGAGNFKDKPLGPWCVLFKNAVVSVGMLRSKGGPALVNPDNPYEIDTTFKADSTKRIAELENYCNIKAQKSQTMITGVLAKPGAIS